MIHSRVSWMLAPVDRSIIVSAPQMVLHCSFSTSCSARARPLKVSPVLNTWYAAAPVSPASYRGAWCLE